MKDSQNGTTLWHGHDSAAEPANHECSASPALTDRERFLRACACEEVDRPPVWLMRQAGRALPEYRRLKETSSFKELVHTPELAAEATLQPIRRFHFDAAILFSDILVVSEALGQGFEFRDGGGIKMDFTLQNARDIEALDTTAVAERLAYVTEAIKLVRASLNEKTALIGFAASPWTLANFMLEGGSARDFSKAKSLYYSEPQLFAALFEKLTRAITEFLQIQIDAGVDAIQIFDSLGGLLTPSAFPAASGKWIDQIIRSLNFQVPVILFCKGVHGSWQELVNTGANVLGLDSNLSLRRVHENLPPGVGVQGNLDPFLLTTSPKIVAAEAQSILRQMKGESGFIFNLGHGVPPTAKLENIAALVDTVQNFQ